MRSVARRGEEDEPIGDRELVFIPKPSGEGEREVAPRTIPTENDLATFAHLGVFVENVDVNRRCVLNDGREGCDLKETVLDRVHFITDPSLRRQALTTGR